MSKLRITKSIYDALRAHGESTYPQECCGVLVGAPGPEGWTLSYAVCATNMRHDSPQNRYAIAPQQLVKIMREARMRNLEIAGFYHSHPDHPAQWSQTDLADAHWLGCCCVITEVAQGRALTTNSFLLAGALEEDKHFLPQTIEFLD
jgi:proteasome lid subunit RPN8/RPN11